MRNLLRTDQYDRGFTVVIVAVMLTAVLVACSDGSDDDGSATPSTTSETSATSTASSNTASPDNNDASGNATTCGVPSGGASGGAGPVDSDAAGRIVTDTYGGGVMNVEKDTHQGKPVWEVEAAGGRCGRIEVDVDKATGRLVGFETED